MSGPNSGSRLPGEISAWRTPVSPDRNIKQEPDDLDERYPRVHPEVRREVRPEIHPRLEVRPEVRPKVQGRSPNQGELPVSSSADVEAKPTPPVRVDNSDSTAPPHISTFPNLHHATITASVDSLGKYKETGLIVLEEILSKLSRVTDSRDAIGYADTIHDLKEQAQNPKTILGVVGSTGHGKSSLINALLGETRLVPTNCVQACTAVITEISWNDSDDPGRRYVAKIEFISAAEWLHELEILFADISASPSEASGNFSNGDSDAGIAWAKVKAVYPGITRDQLVLTSAMALSNDAAVHEYLGSTQTVYGSEAASFYKQVEVYIDSLQRGPAAENAEGHGPRGGEQKMQFWPLVKVVRIHTKADALSTGAVIVDLPGVEDSNAARAAIAAKYIEKCSGIWVLAAITRAINDKAAHQLLGQSFKQQLNYDGNYSRVTFICSKTDDITLNEAAEFLGLRSELDALQSKSAAIQRWEENSEQQLKNDENRSSSLSSYIRELERQVSQWEKLETRHRKGEVVRAAQIRPKKRKAPTQSSRATKRLKASDRDVSAYVSASAFWDSLAIGMPQFSENDPLNGEQIGQAIDYLRTTKDNAYDEKEKLDDKIENERDNSEALKEDYTKTQSDLLSSCIRKRNEYARNAMRRDFAQGLRELDHENAQRENPGEFDPETDLRDYNKVAQSLEVFCVSSKAYQGLSGRQGRRNAAVEGFDDLEATEIPQLIAHAKQLTEEGRTKGDKSFLNRLLQILNSLYMWCSTQYAELEFSDEEKSIELSRMKDGLMKLDKDLKLSLRIFVRNSKEVLTKHLFSRLETSVEKAIADAPTIAGSWPQQERGDGRLPFHSYKSACKRSGVYAGKLGKRDFNEDLVRPLKCDLAQKWVDAFQQNIPKALAEFTHASERLLRDFHCRVKDRVQKKASFRTINALQSQVGARALGITHMVNSFSNDITALQREASRKFNSAVMKYMAETYSACAELSGRGCFARMQQRMLDDIETDAKSIFKSSTEPVKTDLTRLCQLLQTGLEAKIAALLDGMNQDYTSVILGQHFTGPSKQARDELLDLLKKVDERFQHVPADRGHKDNLNSINQPIVDLAITPR
ncbi:hypothetical protein F4677DRAFT_424372 [Hypoxylon crocopeplum]|nr:hypothetical protein F4677DRAFT_424372 [Hypoxylon crocopeplum]